IDGFKLFFPLFEGLSLTGIEGHIGISMAEIGINIVFFNALLDDFSALIAQLKDGLKPRIAHIFTNRFDIMPNAGHNLPTISARTAKSNMARLKKSNVSYSIISKSKGGIDARKPPADHHNVYINIRIKRGKVEEIFFRRGVIGSGIDLFNHFISS